jgi:antiviral defense system Shedu protein SduA
MQAAYSDSTIQWPHQLFTRRTLQTNCEVVFDFDWVAIFDHNYPNFSGLQDLSQAISQFARICGKTPLLLLSDNTDVAFDELTTDTQYVAIVNIRDFRASAREDYDRSALFFLSAFSPHGNISAASAGPATPLRVQQLLKALEVGLDGKNDVLIEVVNKGGSNLTLALLDAAVKGLEKNARREDLEALTSIFSTSTASVIADAATAAKRRVAVEEFERLLNKNANELEFQPWFKVNAWVLGSDCVRILDARRIDISNIADFLVEGYDGRADVVELKRPSLRFWQSDKDHDNYIPHADLVAAIIQAQNYQFALEGEMDSLKARERLGGIPIARPSSLLIHGRSLDWNDKHFEAQRLLNAGFTSLNVITYDQVLRRAKIIIGCNP